jgi:hypothetical protein
VPIPAIVSGELADYKAQCNPDGLVFPSVTGTPLRNRNWRRDVFDSAVETLGLRITPHNLRDTAASLAVQEGAPSRRGRRQSRSTRPRRSCSTTSRHMCWTRGPRPPGGNSSRPIAASWLATCRARRSADLRARRWIGCRDTSPRRLSRQPGWGTPSVSGRGGLPRRGRGRGPQGR